MTPTQTLIVQSEYQDVLQGLQALTNQHEKTYRIRFRIDGILQEVMRPNLKLKDPLTSRVKILAKLNIAERRLPQVGRIRRHYKGRTVDFRVNVLPSRFGE